MDAWEASPHIADAAAATQRIHGLGLYDQWEKLVLQPLAKLTQLSKEAFPDPLAIVVDALDECDNNDNVSLLIRCLAAAVAVEHVDLRIFVTSRPDQPISIGFGDISTDTHQDFILHDIEQSIVDQDLAVYYKHQLGQIARTSRLDAAFLSDDAIQTLVQKSCGFFIYAATVCRFVRAGESSQSPAPRRRTTATPDMAHPPAPPSPASKSLSQAPRMLLDSVWIMGM